MGTIKNTTTTNPKPADWSTYLATMSYGAKLRAGGTGRADANRLTMRGRVDNRILTLPPEYSVANGWRSGLVVLDGDQVAVLLSRAPHTQGGEWYSNHADNHELDIALDEPWSRLVRYHKWTVAKTTDLPELDAVRLDIVPVDGTEQAVRVAGWTRKPEAPRGLSLSADAVATARELVERFGLSTDAD